jgi:hypothetical protein
MFQGFMNKLVLSYVMLTTGASVFIYSVHAYWYNYRVNLKVRVKVTPEQATESQRGSRGIVIVFL